MAYSQVLHHNERTSNLVYKTPNPTRLVGIFPSMVLIKFSVKFKV